MRRLYSPSTQNTYLAGVNMHVKPADAVEISEARYLEVIANPPPGKMRSHDADGLPILIDPPQALIAELAELAHSRQVEALNRACESAITGGFLSNALGAPHYYSSQLEDQLNLTGVILSEVDSLYACRDAQGLKDFRQHTAQQMRQVGDDFTAFKLQLLQKAHRLKQQLDLALAAGDLATLESVTWETEL